MATELDTAVFGELVKAANLTHEESHNAWEAFDARGTRDAYERLLTRGGISEAQRIAAQAGYDRANEKFMQHYTVYQKVVSTRS